MHSKFAGRACLPLIIAALLPIGCGSQKAQTAAAFPPVPVSVAVAAVQALPVEIRAIGNVEPFQSVQVKSQIAGELLSVRFVEGGNVNRGDLLFEIDARPYQEALRQAEAAVARDVAQLRQAEANLARDRAQSKNAEAEAARWAELFKEGIASRTQYDQTQSNADSLRASVRADEAAIESARASLESDRAAAERAKLDLAYCEIRAPLSGRAGNLLVHPGNLVKANGDNALVVINQIAPIFVSFGVPEQHLAAIRRGSSTRKLPVEVSPQDDPAKAERGILSVIDNTIDTATGTIRLKAICDNARRILWPGGLVNVVLTLDTETGAIVVPSEAIQAGQQGQFVYVVKSDQTVEFRIVQVGPAVAGKAVIQKGVAAGETVVTDGQLRLFPGARIKAVPASRIESQAL